jgi:nucleoid-associated protein YgaU
VTVSLRFTAALALAITLAGCDRFFPKDASKTTSEADRKVATGDFRGAVRLYESAFDGTAKTADAHYKLALLYEDKLKRPRDAVHHLERYLELAPAGTHAREARTMKQECEKRLAAALAQGSPMSQSEAVRLKNENARLSKQLVDLQARRTLPPVALGKDGAPPPGARTHTVEPGDTLASIARKYYRNQNRARDIQDANYHALKGGTMIKPGQTLIIP